MPLQFFLFTGSNRFAYTDRPCSSRPPRIGPLRQAPSKWLPRCATLGAAPSDLPTREPLQTEHPRICSLGKAPSTQPPPRPASSDPMDRSLALTLSALLCSPNTTGHSTPSLSTDPFSSLPDPLLYSHTCVTAIVTHIFMRLHMCSGVLTHVSLQMCHVSLRVCVYVPSYISHVTSRTFTHVSHAP
jgi:hypothetical protein